MKTEKHRVAIAIACLCLVATSAQAIDPTVTFQVTTTADLVDDDTADRVCHTSAGTCSLRAAVMQANHLDTNGQVRIDIPSGTYTLTLPVLMDGYDGDDRGDLNITTPISSGERVVIAGDSAATTILDGNHSSSLFNIAQGAKVSLSDVTLRDGYNFFSGGALINRGTLDLSYCVVENNEARADGGGIENQFGVLQVDHCTIRANSGYYGGGISVAGYVRIEASTLSGNSAAIGGGIYSDGDLTVVSSTVSGNTANGNGGGIYSRIHAYLYSSSVIDNIADLDHDEVGGAGGGVYAEAGSGSFLLVNSLIARNSINGGYDANDCHGGFALYGFNLFSEVSSCALAGNGAAGWTYLASPNDIGPLRDNGGEMRHRTFTHALRAGSNAIDASTSQGCIDDTGASLSGDQRGAVRVAGTRCDVGAVESGTVVDTIFFDRFE